jgi:peptidyl-prolyl cis-trans isomerase D
VLGNADGVIKLGPVLKKDLPAGALADGVFAAPQGIAPEPIKSALGWHVVRINNIEAGKVTPFEQVKEKIETDLKAQLAPDLLIKLVTDFERSLGKTQSMVASAQEFNLKVHTVEGVDARGQDASGKQVVIGPAASELVQAAFSTRESSESQLLETPKGEYFVVRTDRVTPARVPALSEVEAKVVDAWQAEERRKLADQKVKEALEKANSGGDLGAIAKDLGLELRTTKPVTRYEADTGNYLTQQAVQELFKLAIGKAQSVRSAEGSVIVRPKEIQAADLAKDKDALDRFGKQLDTMIANDLVTQLLGALRGKYGVTVNEQVFAAAFSPQQQQ